MTHICDTTSEKKARMSKLKIRSMLICFFDSQGIVHTDLWLKDKLLISFITLRFLKE